MLYLIQQALKTAKEKEQEEEPSNFFDRKNYQYVTPNSFKINGQEYKPTGPGLFHISGPTGPSGPVGDPGQRVDTMVNSGDRFDDYEEVIESLLDNKYQTIDPDFYDQFIEDYLQSPEDMLTITDFKEWLEEADVLLSNGTFEESYDLEELIDDYFDGYY